MWNIIVNVLLGEEQLPSTTATIKLPERKHEIKLQRDGYKP